MTLLTFAYFHAMIRGFTRFSIARALPLAVLALAGQVGMAFAAELVMFDRAGCPWCRKWDREIADIYPRSDEGKRAPLRRVSLDQPAEEARLLSPPVIYSPTFVLMEDGREIGRITGYASEEAFWGLLGNLLDKAGRKPESR